MNNYSAGIVAIPIMPQNGFPICPNLFIIDSMLGKVSLNTNPVTGLLEETDCTLITYRIVYREILPEDMELGKPLEIEDVVLRNGTLQIPVDFVPLLFSTSRVLEHEEQIDLAFSKFSFRGILAGYRLKVDKSKIEESQNV